MIRLRCLWTWLMTGGSGCVECGRPRYAPGALVADVCKDHYLARVRSLL